MIDLGIEHKKHNMEIVSKTRSESFPPFCIMIGEGSRCDHGVMMHPYVVIKYIKKPIKCCKHCGYYILSL